MYSVVKICSILFIQVIANPALALMNLDLTQGQRGSIPIKLTSVATSKPFTNKVLEVLKQDLSYTNRLDILKSDDKADYSLILEEKKQQLCMKMSTAAQSKHQAEAVCIPIEDYTARSLGHFMAQAAHEYILGKKAIYTSKLAYVREKKKENKRSYTLILADFDGGQQDVLLESDEPIMSPTFSPDASKIAYVSFEGGSSKIFVQEVATGRRELISARPGLNAAPAWSPNGSKLAIVLSTEGRAKIYIHDMKSKQITPMLDERSIQTEPVWTNDAKHIIFTSDRAGSAQIYKLELATKKIQKLTEYGNYNASPSISKDDRYLVYLTRLDRKLQTVVLDLKEKELSWIGSGILDDTPRITVGSMVVYSHSKNAKSSLNVVDVDGSFNLEIEMAKANIKYPTWNR